MDIYYCPWHLRKIQFKTFYYTHIIEIPTNKRANSYKLKISKIGNYKEKNFQLPYNVCGLKIYNWLHKWWNIHVERHVTLYIYFDRKMYKMMIQKTNMTSVGTFWYFWVNFWFNVNAHVLLVMCFIDLYILHK